MRLAMFTRHPRRRPGLDHPGAHCAPPGRPAPPRPPLPGRRLPGPKRVCHSEWQDPGPARLDRCPGSHFGGLVTRGRGHPCHSEWHAPDPRPASYPMTNQATRTATVGGAVTWTRKVLAAVSISTRSTAQLPPPFAWSVARTRDEAVRSRPGVTGTL